MGDFFYGELNDTESTLLGNIDDESDVELLGKLNDIKTNVNADLENIYNDDPENSPYIYGKLLKEVQVEKLSYDGIASETATTYIDNIDQTVKVVVNTDVIATKKDVKETTDKLNKQLEEKEKDLKDYVDEFGGKIDNIFLNGKLQSIKDINIDGKEYKKSVSLEDIATASNLNNLETNIDKKFNEVNKKIDEDIKASIDDLNELTEKALNTKLDKVTIASEFQQVYVKDTDGTQKLLNIKETDDN